MIEFAAVLAHNGRIALSVSMTLDVYSAALSFVRYQMGEQVDS